MAHPSPIRKPLSLVLSVALATGLGGIHCSSNSSDSAPQAVCSGARTTAGQVAAIRFGETELRREVHRVAESDEVVDEVRVERNGEVLIDTSVRLSVRKGDSVVRMEMHYGRAFEGPHDIVLAGTVGGPLDGTADGRALKPFDAKKGSRFVFADGTDIGDPHVSNEVLRREVDGVLAAAAPGGACGAGIGRTGQAVTAPVEGVADGVTRSCVLCRAACFTAASAAMISGELGCVTLLWCPPCWAVCALGVAAATGVAGVLCLEACNNNEWCKKQGAACGYGAAGDLYHCDLDETCFDAGKHLCCPRQTVACGSVCCESTKGESCATGPTGAQQCCIPPSKNIGGDCCASANQFKTPSGIDVCCSSADRVCADGSCCTLGACVGGHCCPNACGSNCCAAGDSCVAGSCCPSERSCGAICCLEGESCRADGTCGPAASITCPTGTVLKTDQADPSKFVCCAPDAIGCNGSCCGSVGQGCCLHGGVFSCGTDCIK